MTKQTNTTTDAAANLTIGQLVEIDVQRDGETTTATGTLTGISKGWYVVQLNEESAEEQGREKISVRAAAIRPAEEDDEIDGEYHDDLDENGNPILMDDEQSVEDALDEAEEHASKMAEALRKARARYVKDRRPNGAATAHNGDLIARELRDYEPREVCDICDRCFDLPKGTTYAKYEHLNAGQQRMNAGNRIRAVWRKAEDIARMERIAQVLGLEEELAAMQAGEQLASIEDRGPEGLEDLQPVEQA